LLGDFNGDGRSDIFWHQPSTGKVRVTIVGANGEQESVKEQFAKNTGWTPSLADFNGDGRQDTLWRNSSDGKVRVVLSAENGGQGIVDTSHWNKNNLWGILLGDSNDEVLLGPV
jgi:hypothetical protein